MGSSGFGTGSRPKISGLCKFMTECASMLSGILLSHQKWQLAAGMALSNFGIDELN